MSVVVSSASASLRELSTYCFVAESTPYLRTYIDRYSENAVRMTQYFSGI
jgi:hypothetical protein